MQLTNQLCIFKKYLFDCVCFCATLLSCLSRFIEFSKCKWADTQTDRHLKPAQLMRLPNSRQLNKSEASLHCRRQKNIQLLARLICLAKCCNNNFECSNNNNSNNKNDALFCNLTAFTVVATGLSGLSGCNFIAHLFFVVFVFFIVSVSVSEY